jgi:hypothetical protein
MLGTDSTWEGEVVRGIRVESDGISCALSLDGASNASLSAIEASRECRWKRLSSDGL